MSQSAKKKILSKSRYTKGLQCEKLLWLTLNEPESQELVPDVRMQARFYTGNKVGVLARTYVPGGVLIERSEDDFEAPLQATREALASGAKVLYEGAFLVDDIYCAIDILEKSGKGWNLVEVKSSVKVKPQYLPDVAVQVFVARKAGLDIKKVEIMVLNSDCRYPDLSNLFVRHDVTEEVEEHIQQVAVNAKRLYKVVNASKAPKKAVGAHCTDPYECPFMDRCHKKVPEHHVSTLYYMNAKTADKLEAQGYKVVSDLDEDAGLKLSPVQLRQIESVRKGKTIVEKGLKRVLATVKGPIGFLDFETVAPAIPTWEGCGPYRGLTAQFSYHVEDSLVAGGYRHTEWVATTPGDPRRELALALINACKGATAILAYSAGFERGRIRELAEFLPDLSTELLEINERIEDLLPMVRDHVYHPKFHGSFSIKDVLPALCPELSYEGLGVADGGAASWILERLMTDPDSFGPGEREKAIISLREYCKLDTWAMVRLVEVLRDFTKRKVG